MQALHTSQQHACQPIRRHACCCAGRHICCHTCFHHACYTWQKTNCVSPTSNTCKWSDWSSWDTAACGNCAGGGKMSSTRTKSIKNLGECDIDCEGYLCTRTRMHIHTHAHTHVHVHTHTRTHAHTRARARARFLTYKHDCRVLLGAGRAAGPSHVVYSYGSAGRTVGSSHVLHSYGSAGRTAGPSHVRRSKSLIVSGASGPIGSRRAARANARRSAARAQ